MNYSEYKDFLSNYLDYVEETDINVFEYKGFCMIDEIKNTIKNFTFDIPKKFYEVKLVIKDEEMCNIMLVYKFQFAPSKVIQFNFHYSSNKRKFKMSHIHTCFDSNTHNEFFAHDDLWKWVNSQKHKEGFYGLSRMTLEETYEFIKNFMFGIKDTLNFDIMNKNLQIISKKENIRKDFK